MTATDPPRRDAAFWIVAALIGALFLALRWNTHPDIYNLDEIIPVAVSQAMSERGDLDTNFRTVTALPAFLQIDTYVFSSYVLVAHAVLSAVGHDAPYATLRWLNVALQGIGIVLIASGLRRFGAGGAVILLVALLLAAAPALVHDAHMARPESLLFLLFAVVFRAAAQPALTAAGVVAAGLALGFGAAAKMTFLLAGLLLLPAALAAMRAQPGRAAMAGAAGAGALAIGLVAGMPALLHDAGGLVSGNSALFAQYAGEHPPHSFPHYSLARNAVRTATFLLLAYGPLALAAAAGVLAMRGRLASGLGILALSTVVLFTIPNVFFERNLVLAVCCCAIAAGLLCMKAPAAGYALAAAALAPMLWWSANIALQSNMDWAGRAAFETARFADRQIQHGWMGDFRGPAPVCADIAAVHDFGDDYSAALHRRLKAARLTELARLRGLFHILPTSTLHTYLSADIVYYDCRTDGAAGSGA